MPLHWRRRPAPSSGFPGWANTGKIAAPARDGAPRTVTQQEDS